MREGTKHDGGKLSLDLVPTIAIRAIARVLHFGAKKYGAYNWADGMDWSRLYAAAQGHMMAWWDRDPGDRDTGFSHLWHASCCVCFLIAYEALGQGTDDRPMYVSDALSQGVDEVAAKLTLTRDPL